MKQSEKDTEKRLNAEVKKVGGWSIKLLSAFVAGLPDRLVLLDGKAYFVEVKSEGEKPTPIQKIIHKKLKSVGFHVYVIDTREKINDFINGIHGK